MRDVSAPGERRNLRRAGTLLKSRRTDTVVPGAVPCLSVVAHDTLDHVQASARILAVRPADQRHGGDGSNARQCFPPEPQGADRVEVGRVGHLAGREPLERNLHLVERDAAAVVGHANQLDSTPAYLHADTRGPRVDRVLHQLLDRRRGALYHLARGDHGGDLRCQQTDWHVS